MLELILVAVLLCLAVVVWSVLIACRRAGQSLVPYEARDLVPWGLLDVFLALGLLWILTAVVIAMLRGGAAQLSGADVTMGDVLAQSIASLAVLAISVMTIVVRYRAAGADLGWSAARIGSDIRLGVVAFLALVPPVYALQTVLVRWFPSKHPLLELIQQNPQPKLIAVCAFSAVVVAPIVEEYLFRGLLQGWLERLADGRDDSQDILLGGPARPMSSDPSHLPQKAAGPVLPRATDADAAHPYQAPAHVAHESPGRADRHVAADMPAAYWPMAVSAFAFAMMHVQHGPDWAPLFLLALGLGYLYRQTHRLLPAITVHCLLNACTLLMLSVS